MAIAAMALVSCNKTALEPLSGVFPVAEEFTLNTLVENTSEKGEKTSTFTLKFSGENNASMDVVFVCSRSTYFLTPAVYVPGESVGSFIADQSKANGKVLKSGTIDVAKNEDHYRLVFNVIDVDGNPYRTKWEGQIVYEPEEAPASFVELTQNFGIIDYTAMGVNMVGIELGTSGVVGTPNGYWGNDYSGTGNYIKLEIYSTDGKIAPGTYKACAEGGVIGAGEFGIGYNGQYGASGTTWYTLGGGETSYEFITDGTVTVEANGDDYKITIESSVVNARYGYTVALTQFWGLSDYTGYGVNLAGIYLASAGLTSDGASIAGDGYYLKLEYYTTAELAGLPAPGEYTACTVGGEVGAGQFGIGYDGAWGESGTAWYTVTGGVPAGQYVTDGTLSVSLDGDVYTIVLDSSVATAIYVGKLGF